MRKVADAPEGGTTGAGPVPIGIGAIVVGTRPGGTGLGPIGSDVTDVATRLGGTEIAEGMIRGLEVTRASGEGTGPIGLADAEMRRTRASGADDGTRLRVLSLAPRSPSPRQATLGGTESFRVTGYGLSMLDGCRPGAAAARRTGCSSTADGRGDLCVAAPLRRVVHLAPAPRLGGCWWG